MRKNRQIRHRKKRHRISPLELDITSLLDILVILLVFLIKSYNSSGIVLQIPKGVSLPHSESQDMNTSGVMVQVSPSHIWVDEKMIVNHKAPPPRLYDHGGRRIIPLYNELAAKRKIVESIEKSSARAKKFSGIINLIVDKSLKYSYLKKLMYTCAQAGFKQYKFVVLGEE